MLSYFNVLMKNTSTKLSICALAITVAALATDQLLKNILISRDIFWFSPWEWLSVQISYNQGIAFSLPFPIIPLTITSAAIIAAVITAWARYRAKNALQAIGVGLFIGGALGNLIDRILHKAVIDYLNVLTSSFNLADIVIVAGIILLIFAIPIQKPNQVA